MSYLDALKKRGFGVESLPKGLQKKISEYKLISEQIAKAEESGLSDEMETLQAGLAELDEYLERKITIFDPEKHQRKLAVIAQMNQRNPKVSNYAPKEPVKVEPKIEEAIPEVQQVQDDPEVPELPVKTEQYVPEPNHQEPEPEIPVQHGPKKQAMPKGKKMAFACFGLSVLFAIMGVSVYNKK